MENLKFNQQIEKVGELYENAKDQMIRLDVPPGMHGEQNALFLGIQELRNIACTALQQTEALIQELNTEHGEAIRLINAERLRILSLGFTPEHDQKYVKGELPEAAISYLLSGTFEDGPNLPSNWPFDSDTFKPSPHNRLRELAKAANFIVSEMNRILFANEVTELNQTTN